jgi:hypothetical protein
VLPALVPAASVAAGDTVRYKGETEDGRKVKLVADQRGEVLRGAINAVTDCSGDFDDFRARVELSSPLDRTNPRGFRDEGSFEESDDVYSARYRYLVKGEHESDRVIAGSLDLEVVFRRKGKEYVTCTVEDLVFSAQRAKTAGGRAIPG